MSLGLALIVMGLISLAVSMIVLFHSLYRLYCIYGENLTVLFLRKTPEEFLRGNFPLLFVARSSIHKDLLWGASALVFTRNLGIILIVSGTIVLLVK